MFENNYYIYAYIKTDILYSSFVLVSGSHTSNRNREVKKTTDLFIIIPTTAEVIGTAEYYTLPCHSFGFSSPELSQTIPDNPSDIYSKLKNVSKNTI